MSEEELEVPEPMAAFFDARAAGYDDRQRDFIFPDELFAQFYQALSSPIPMTHEPLSILDLGCGTGLELAFLFERVPNALITGVDVAGGMLELLRKTYSARMDQITLVSDSYLTMPFGTHEYDYVISALANHHVLHDTKRRLYTKIHASLKPGASFIEGDSVTLADSEDQFLAEYHEQVASMPPAEEGHYHIDVPLAMDTQRSLLLEAGFRDFRLLWQRDPTAVWNIAVYAVTA
jgi:tRNA (cmo5U34)-methyltransferase